MLFLAFKTTNYVVSKALRADVAGECDLHKECIYSGVCAQIEKFQSKAHNIMFVGKSGEPMSTPCRELNTIVDFKNCISLGQERLKRGRHSDC